MIFTSGFRSFRYLATPEIVPPVPLDDWDAIPGLVELWAATVVEPFGSGPSAEVGSCPLDEAQVERIVATYALLATVAWFE